MRHRSTYPRELLMSPTYHSWRAMKVRCSGTHSSSKGYEGISYPDKWKTFAGFLEDMGVKPLGLSLDRIETEKSYSKENCRWATPSKQVQNRKPYSNTGMKHITKAKTRSCFYVCVYPFRNTQTKTIQEAILKRDYLLNQKEFINFKGDTMLYDTITFTKKKNLGNYESEELSLSASVEEGEDVLACIMQLKGIVTNALEGVIAPVAVIETPKLVVEKVALKPLGNEPAATANFVKEKAAPRTRAAKPKAEVNESGVEVPPVIPQEAAPSQNTGAASQVVGSVDRENVTHVQPAEPKAAPPVAKGIVAYDSRVKEQRSRFATFLGTTYPKWKTAHPEEKIKEFSLGLQGKPFEDAKGNMLDSFKAELEAFFGHAK